MKNDNASASERAAALVNEALDVLQRSENAPGSPVNSFLTVEMRRKYRRAAKRLRQRKTQPRYKNLYSAEELAAIFERTVQRDEIIEQGQKDFLRITLALGRVLEENDPEVGKALDTLFMDMARSAEEQGPGSEAARRYRHLQMLAWLAQRGHDYHQRQRLPAPLNVPLASDPSIEARNQLIATEVLDTPPSEDEAVIAIPPEERDSGRGRVFLRIGLGEASWIGSGEIGHMNVSTITMMPDDKHLFVSAEGAGYIIDLKSRTLVEEIGTDVAGVLVDERRTVFIVDHNGMSLEGFGKTGRLWKTDTISCGGFRDTAVTDTRFIGETLLACPPGWVRFSVKLATGEVRFGDAL